MKGEAVDIEIPLGQHGHVSLILPLLLVLFHQPSIWRCHDPNFSRRFGFCSCAGTEFGVESGPLCRNARP
ncbi:MAG: hypothetical protein WCF17_09035 [Terracidiphilus sp.]